MCFLLVILYLGYALVSLSNFQSVSSSDRCVNYFQQPIQLDIDSFVPDPGSDANVVDFGTIRLTKKARNHFVISGTFEIFRNIGNDAKGSIVVLRKDKLSGRYSQQIYNLRENYCKYWDTEESFLPALRTFSNLPEKGACPFPKGQFTIKDYEFTEEQFPKIIPPGDYLVRFSVSEDDKLLWGAEVFLTINP